MVAPLVPADLHAQLRAWAPGGKAIPLESTVGGFSNLTFIAQIGEERAIVKAAATDAKRPDVRREAEMLGRLAEVEPAFAVPEVLVLLEGAWTVLVMRHVEGAGVWEGRPSPTGLRARSVVLGRLLRSVHQCSLSPVGADMVDLDLGQRASVMSAMLGDIALPTETVAKLRNALAHPCLQRGVSLVHGDFGLHNVLWQVGVKRQPLVSLLYDWEWSGWGNPLVDVAWLWWTFQHRNMGLEPWDAFVATYGETSIRSLGWDTECVTAAVRAQMAQIILRTSANSSHREEWLARLTHIDALRV